MRRRLGTSIVCILAFSISLSVESMASDSIDEAEERGFKVVRTIPLEETSFTQGLEVLEWFDFPEFWTLWGISAYRDRLAKREYNQRNADQ